MDKNSKIKSLLFNEDNNIFLFYFRESGFSKMNANLKIGNLTLDDIALLS